MKSILLSGVAGAIMGALAGWDLDLMGTTHSPAGVGLCACAGLILGLLAGLQQRRYETSTVTRTPHHAWATTLGLACLALSLFSFVASQRVPGVRPIAVAGAPIRLDSSSSARLSFTPDTTARYAVLLIVGEDPAVKLARDLGLKGGSQKPPEPLPPRETMAWTSDVPGSHRDAAEHVFETSGARQVNLGSLYAAAGQTYTLTATVVKPLPAAAKSDARIEVHRTIASWASAFPRMLAAGAVGLVAGIAGIMLMVYGVLTRYAARQGDDARTIRGDGQA